MQCVAVLVVLIASAVALPGHGDAEGSLAVDSAMTLKQALAGTRAPTKIVSTLTIVTVRYRSFDHREHQGQLVVRRDLAAQVQAIFDKLLEMPAGKPQ